MNELKTEPKGCPKCNKGYNNTNPRYRFCPICASPLLIGDAWQTHLVARKVARYADKVMSSLPIESDFDLDDISIGGVSLREIIKSST